MGTGPGLGSSRWGAEEGVWQGTSPPPGHQPVAWGGSCCRQAQFSAQEEKAKAAQG